MATTGIFVMTNIFGNCDTISTLAHAKAEVISSANFVKMPTRKHWIFFKLKTNPENLLGLTGFISGLISFLPIKHDTYDINLHDTYFVITNVSLYYFFAVLFLFVWAIYFLLKPLLLSPKLTWAFVISTLISLLWFIILCNVDLNWCGIPRRYYAFNEVNRIEPYYNQLIFISILIFLKIFSQLLLLVNILGGIIKRVYFSLKNKM